MENNIDVNTRYEWVDIFRGIAMIFIFIGHWGGIHITTFAYNFHLEAFYLIAGFFVVGCSKKYKFKEYVKKKSLTIMVPLLIWSFIVLIFKSLDSKFSIHMIIEWIKDPAGTAGNYWFLPSLFSFSIVYYILEKKFKNLWLVLLFFFILKIRLNSYSSIFNYYNDFINLFSNISITKIFLNYFNISSLPPFFMWYFLVSLIDLLDN